MRFSNFNYGKKNALLLFGTLIMFSSCEGELEVVQRIDEEFSGIERIEIESSFMEVNYEGRSGQTTVVLDGLLESSRSGNFKIEYKQEGNTLFIELDQNGMFGGGNHRAVVNLTGPRELDLDVDSGSGQTMVSGIEFPGLEINSGSGNIQVSSSIVPDMHLEVGSGSIQGFNLIGNLDADAGSGKIEIEQMEGDLDIEASSGAIQVKSLTGRLNVEMSSGNVDLSDVSEVEGLKVSSGNISGAGVGLGPKTKLVSSSGRIVIQTFSNLVGYNYDFEAGSGRVIVGESSSSGSLKINNGASNTISGSVSSGLIEIKN
jgi:lia operon protein LiaG